MNPDDLPTPDELAELLPQYRFLHLIAEGGMGAVYCAEQISLARPVAIKILPRSLSADATYREQFKGEARLMGALNHPHIVNVHDFGVAGDVLFIVMELLEGTNLYQRIQQGALKQQEVVRILTQVCDALSAAHQKGVIHRDIKPENIFLDQGLVVKLGDFGIARLRPAEADELPAAATSGVRLGTPEYAAPELYDFHRHIDHRADLFSLGVVLYEMLTGIRPTETFIPPSHRRPGLDKRFDSVVIRAMQADPEERYPDAGEMKRDLLRILQSVNAQPLRPPAAGKVPTGQSAGRQIPPAAPKTSRKPVEEEPPPAPVKKKKKRKSSGAASMILGLLGVSAVGFGFFYLWNSQKKEKEKSKATDVPVPKTEKATALELFKKPDPSGGGMPGESREPDAGTPGPGPPAAKFFFAGHTYQYVPSHLSWKQARDEAEQKGGHLACVTSQEEYDALRAYLLPLLKAHGDGAWLGASNLEPPGTWKWITGESFSFTAWASDAPNNGGGDGEPQNYLCWQRQNKYTEKKIEWNDVAPSLGSEKIAGALIEWDRLLEDNGSSNSP